VIASVNEFYNKFGQVLNVIGDDVRYTYNLALMFYNNLALDIHDQIKASRYLPPETFGDNLSQVQGLSALQDLSLKAELEVAYIISISNRSNGASVHACLPEHSPTKQLFPLTVPYAPVMAISLAMSVRNQLFPPPPNFPPPSFHEQPVFAWRTPSDQYFSNAMKLMCNAIVVLHKMCYRKHTAHRQAALKITSVILYKLLCVSNGSAYVLKIALVEGFSSRTVFCTPFHRKAKLTYMLHMNKVVSSLWGLIFPFSFKKYESTVISPSQGPGAFLQVSPKE
jgi:hypothetical protein